MRKFDDPRIAESSKVLLVPGFLSPAWTPLPLKRFLTRSGIACSIWDDPFVGRDLGRSVGKLSQDIASISKHSEASVVAHSFGDWLVRKCLSDDPTLQVGNLVSIGPVTTAVPAARVASKMGLGQMSEIRVMADQQRAEIEVAATSCKRRTVIWPRYEYVVAKGEPRGDAPTKIESVIGTHVSVLFQPRVHRMVCGVLTTPTR